MSVDDLLRRYYSDQKYNGTRLYYDWIRANLHSDMRILNIGAGPETNDPLRILKGEVLEVVGIDIDPVVLVNAELDRAYTIEEDKFPFKDEYFDIVYCDYVLEHVADPRKFLCETLRVMKRNARFFFRTPNLYHYVPAISMLTPDWLHKALANRVRMLPEDAHEPWPTFYRMNTRRRLRKLAATAGFSQTDFRMIECEPSYLKFHPIPFMAGVCYERLVNSADLFSGLRVQILGQFRR